MIVFFIVMAILAVALFIFCVGSFIGDEHESFWFSLIGSMLIAASLWAGYAEGKRRTRQEAIKAKVGEYAADPETAEVDFKWKKQP